jgi:hypothetical protein
VEGWCPALQRPSTPRVRPCPTSGQVGTMNVFFAFKGEGPGALPELVTPPLDGTILPGVTRDSVLALARSWRGQVRSGGAPR